MNHEDSRLRTFSEWPSDAPVDACRIANGGFFYTGQGVEVQCFSCGGKISEWSAGDAIMTKHRRLDPRCPFIVDPITSGNVPKQSQNSHTNNVHQTQSIQIQPPTIENEVEHLRNSQNARLESFRNWPIGHVVTPQNLSEAGFYSIQQGDMVKCAFCNGIVGFWEIGDDPRSEHRRHFPQCSFVVRNFNEPQANSSSSTNVSITATTPTDLQELGIQTHKGPRMSDYATVESRLRTYTNWPGDLIQTPDMLSEAGFYYVGTGDQVRCFHCDGGLRHWDPQDDPWVEHAKWFPTCSFVRIIKGADFINSYKPEGETGEIRNETCVKRSAPFTTTRTVTEAEVQAQMRTQPVLEALNIGIDLGRIKYALRYKLQMTGTGFLCTDTLIEAALNMDFIDLGNGFMELDSESTSEEVSRILSAVLMKSEQEVKEKPGNTTETPTETKVEKEEQVTKTDSERSDVNLSLEEENRLLREARLCKICMDNEIGIVFLPCGHLTTCVNCAPSLKDCPVCRSVIKATVRTFLS